MRNLAGRPDSFHRMKDRIRIRGARQHNLKGFDLDIPRRAITVVTGVSGSGKSSLAFDTIYATCGDQVYRRKVNTRGAFAWEAPYKPAPPRL